MTVVCTSKCHHIFLFYSLVTKKKFSLKVRCDDANLQAQHPGCCQKDLESDMNLRYILTPSQVKKWGQK